MEILITAFILLAALVALMAGVFIGIFAMHGSLREMSQRIEKTNELLGTIANRSDTEGKDD